MKNPISKLSVMIFTLIAMGCSDVNFAPAPGYGKAGAEGQESNTQQGVPPTGLNLSASDSFFSNGSVNNKVDILFVIDNSGSMHDEQTRLGQRLGAFTDHLAGLDWQLGITTTDVSDGPFGLKGDLIAFSNGSTFINANTANYAVLFNETIVRDESINCLNNCPSGLEQPIAASIMAIQKRDTSNSGFFRVGADLAVIMVTDEDEMSTGPANATDKDDFLNFTNALWANEKKVSVSGIIVEPGDSACLSTQADTVTYGNVHAALINATGGISGSICDNDYAGSLSKIGERVLEQVNAVQLTFVPNPATVKVSFEPHIDVNWSVVGQKILFDQPIPNGTRIDVDYDKSE